MDVAWQPCKDDGGSPITGYQVMIRDVTRTAWLQAATVGPNETSATVRDLTQGLIVFIRRRNGLLLTFRRL